jgi:methylamine dehydrogenase accessory protein MauD
MASGLMIGAQGCVLVCLGLVVLAHSRLLGLLHQRLGPAGARPLADGPALGAKLDRLDARRLDGSPWSADFPAETGMILVFISPQCQTCNALMPHVQDFVRTQPDVPLTLVSTIDDAAMNRAYIAYRRLEDLPYILGEKMSAGLDIEGTPYALYVSQDGLVLGKGIVNTFENLMGLHEQGNRPEGFAARGEESAAVS